MNAHAETAPFYSPWSVLHHDPHPNSSQIGTVNAGQAPTVSGGNTGDKIPPTNHSHSPAMAHEILGGVAGACSGIKCGENRTGTESATSGDSVERHATNSNSSGRSSSPDLTDKAGEVTLPSASPASQSQKAEQP